MDVCSALNNSKVAWAISALCINLGSRYLMQDATGLQQAVLSSAVFKRVVVFCIVFMSTRDVLLSATVTAFAWIVLNHLLNEGSAFCIVPGLCASPGSATSSGPAAQVKDPVTRQMYARALDVVRGSAPQDPGVVSAELDTTRPQIHVVQATKN